MGAGEQLARELIATADRAEASGTGPLYRNSRRQAVEWLHEHDERNCPECGKYRDLEWTGPWEAEGRRGTLTCPDCGTTENYEHCTPDERI